MVIVSPYGPYMSTLYEYTFIFKFLPTGSLGFRVGSGLGFELHEGLLSRVFYCRYVGTTFTIRMRETTPPSPQSLTLPGFRCLSVHGGKPNYQALNP